MTATVFSGALIAFKDVGERILHQAVNELAVEKNLDLRVRQVNVDGGASESEGKLIKVFELYSPSKALLGSEVRHARLEVVTRRYGISEVRKADQKFFLGFNHRTKKTVLASAKIYEPWNWILNLTWRDKPKLVPDQVSALKNNTKKALLGHLKPV